MQTKSKGPWTTAAAIFASVLGGAAVMVAGDARAAWPEWDRFAERFVQADGRVIDLTFDAKSTSEGQSYGLFFALVADDRARFEKVLDWTSSNLADSRLGEQLPGWLWGRHDDGSWAIKDRNAAADADLWLAYTLMEAGRLWQEPRYDTLGRQLLALVHDREVADAGAAGLVLLPGPVGFELSNQRFRINPSYLPGFMFEYFTVVDPQGPWAEIWQGYLRAAPEIFAAGVAPDLYVVNSRGDVTEDSERTPAGSYDAIRVYLWAGMSGEQSAELVRLLTPFARIIGTLGTPPEKVDPASGRAIEADYSPIGFAGAVLPFLAALDEDELLRAQLSRLRIDADRARRGAATNYYDQALILFGQGWLDGQYRFDDQGRLQPEWQ